MKKNGLYILAIAVFLFFATPKTFACDCTSMLPVTLNARVNKALKEADAVFTGVVESIAEDKENRNKTIKLKLLKVWKGNLLKEVEIVTGWGDGDCGYNFTVGETYLVYASKSGMYNSGERFTTSICSRTTVVEAAQKDIILLNRRKKPK